MIAPSTSLRMLPLLLMLSMPVQAELVTILSFGYGLGESHTQGDYTEALSNRIFSGGFDVETRNILFIIKGQSSIDNHFRQMDLLVGFGNEHVKIATGFIGLQTSVPTNPDALFDTSGTNATERDRRIDLSVTSIPLYLRIKPYASDHFQIVMDAYLGLYSRGSMTFPLFATRPGQYATVSSESKEQGGTQGYSLSATWRLRNKKAAIQLEYQYREATMIKQTSRFDTDVLGLLGTVTTPELTFQNRAVLLNYVLVK